MITGGVTSGIYLADVDTTFAEGCFFSGIVGTQRVKVQFTHNKTEYNQEIFNNNASGDFDSNLLSIRIWLSDSPPLPSNEELRKKRIRP